MATNVIYGLGNSNWSEDTADRLAAPKQTHEKSVFVSQAGTVVAATTYVFGLKGAAATLKTFRARIEESVATGADRTVTIDCQKSTGGGAYATVLSATLVFTNLSSLRSWSSATFSNTSLVADDVLKITVAVAGSASAQAAGLIIELTATPVDPS